MLEIGVEMVVYLYNQDLERMENHIQIIEEVTLFLIKMEI
jgi:hypothetical protein